MNAIFLDIDGVLYSYLYRKNIFQKASKLRTQVSQKGYVREHRRDFDLYAVVCGVD